jgi:chloramphenicol O-acetyltransferase type A
MKRILNIHNWSRKDHFHFFKQFEEPFFGIVAEVDVTIAYQRAKKDDFSFFLWYLHGSLKAANAIESFRYRIEDESVVIYDKINASPTINRADGTFGFSYMEYFDDFKTFEHHAKREIERVQTTVGLEFAASNANIIHYSSLPWIRFTSISHARSFSFKDCIPKISFGKVVDERNKKWIPVSIHLHHALADGYHAGQFLELFQTFLNEV